MLLSLDRFAQCIMQCKLYQSLTSNIGMHSRSFTGVQLKRVEILLSYVQAGGKK
jgi:hypothetical protein